MINSGFWLNSFVSSALVDMYGKCGHLEMAIEVFEQMPKKSVVAWNSMITGYGFKGDCFSCVQLFKRMYNEGVKPTLTTLSSILIFMNLFLPGLLQSSVRYSSDYSIRLYQLLR